MPPTAIVMHPRRWYWMAAALDTQNRPLVSIAAPAVDMAQIASGERVTFEGPVGTLLGIPVYLDPNLPITLGVGTNEDTILVVRAPDLWLWEGTLRTRAMNEVLSNTLSVRLQVYNYVAASGARYPAGVSQVGGTGLITPTF
jgi:hypothetical protein